MEKEILNHLTAHEHKRYQRLLSLPGFGVEALTKIRQTRIVVVGAGSLGATVLQHLAMCGFIQLGVVDNDTITEENLAGQTFFGSKDLGKQKAIAARAKLEVVNHQCSVEIFNICLSQNNSEAILGGFDLVVDCTDNFPAKLLINDTCTRLRKSWIFGFTNAYKGYYALLDGQHGPTLRCLYPEPKKTSEVFAEGMEYGITNSVTGTLMVHQIVLKVTGQAKEKASLLHEVDIMAMQFASRPMIVDPKNLIV